MSGSTVSEKYARPIRGGVQGGAAWAILEFVEAFAIYDFTERQLVIATLVLAAIISFAQNAAEQSRGKGFFLRTIDPPEQASVAGA